MNDSRRNRMNGFQTIPPEGEKLLRNSGKLAGILIAIIVVIILIFNSTYQIREQEQAVLITFGNAQAVTEPGLHFKIPFVQKVKKVNTVKQDGKVKRFRGYEGVRSDYKKAIITLADGQNIDVTAGI